MTIKDQILTATDTLNDTRRAYYQQRASYDDVAAAASTSPLPARMTPFSSTTIERAAPTSFKLRSIMPILRGV